MKSFVSRRTHSVLSEQKLKLRTGTVANTGFARSPHPPLALVSIATSVHYATQLIQCAARATEYRVTLVVAKKLLSNAFDEFRRLDGPLLYVAALQPS